MTLVDHEAVREVRDLQQLHEHSTTTPFYAFIHHRVKVNQVRLILLDNIYDVFDFLYSELFDCCSGVALF